jgi:hypothetical protein
MITQILVWFIMSYGLMNIMVYGSIFQGLRDFLKRWGDNKQLPFNFLGNFLSGLINCPLCFSTWSGFVLSLLIFSPTNHIFNTPLGYSWFFDGITSAGAVWAINSIIEWFEENRPNNNN